MPLGHLPASPECCKAIKLLINCKEIVEIESRCNVYSCNEPNCHDNK